MGASTDRSHRPMSWVRSRFELVAAGAAGTASGAAACRTRAALGLGRDRFPAAREPEPSSTKRDRTQLTYLFGLSDGSVIEGAQGGNAARHANHACNPKAESVESHGATGELIETVRMLRRVRAGEEVFLDYALVIDGDDPSDDPCACAQLSSARSRAQHPPFRSRAGTMPWQMVGHARALSYFFSTRSRSASSFDFLSCALGAR